MKLILDDFNYKGHHFDEVEFNLPQRFDFDETFEERIIPYITEQLDLFIKDEES